MATFLSFLVPFGILGLVYIHFGMYPFGGKTILISDMSGQYVDFYSAYYDILTQGKSLLYSWYGGMGLNFLGLFAYYLSSPFSLCILLFPKESLTEALLFVTLFKIGSAGLTFSLYAGYTLQPSRILTILFSTLYALMAYSVVYTFNLMWLDGVVFLPLILLGVEKILREQKVLFFTFSLIAVFFANFYVAYMAGIFSFLYFLAAFFSANSIREMKLFLGKLLAFSFSTLLAAGCASVLLIPTFFALKNGQGGPDFFLSDWRLNLKLWKLFSKTQLGAYDTLTTGGSPNIYCGLLPLLLLPNYFFQKSIPVKERILYAILLGFLAISFFTPDLDIIWHAFDKPNSFPYRYSFVFSFLILFLSLKSFQTLQFKDLPKIALIAVGLVILIPGMQKITMKALPDKLFFIPLLFLSLYGFILMGSLIFMQKRKVFWTAMAILILVESTLSTWQLIKKLDGEFSYVTRNDYLGRLNQYEEVLEEIEHGNQGQEFYRVDRIGGRSYNDPLNLTYQGITHFSSMSNSGLNQTLSQLGFLSTAGFKSVNFAGSTPITESLLGVKYVLSLHRKGLGYEEIPGKGEVKGYENKNVLPLGFLVDRDLLLFNPLKENNPFLLQNKFIHLAQGRELSKEKNMYFSPILLKGMNLRNAAVTMEKGKETFKRKNMDQEGSVEFILINPQEQQVYACFQTINNTVRLYLNDQEIKGYLPVYNKRIVDLGFHHQNEELRIKLTFTDKNISLEQKYFSGLRHADLIKALSPLQKDVLKNIQVSETEILGRIQVKDEIKSLLFTSIPYDPGWEVKVDGKEASIRKIGNAFIGVELTEGQHELSFQFKPQGLKIGLILSGISLILLLYQIRVSFSANPK